MLRDMREFIDGVPIPIFILTSDMNLLNRPSVSYLTDIHKELSHHFIPDHIREYDPKYKQAENQGCSFITYLFFNWGDGQTVAATFQQQTSATKLAQLILLLKVLHLNANRCSGRSIVNK